MAQERVTAEFLVERDGRECVWCGREVWEVDQTIEHLCPRNRGGQRTEENSLLACSSCNRERKSRSAVAFALDRWEQGLEPRWSLLEAVLQGLSESGRRQHRLYAEAQLRHLPAALNRVGF